MAQPAASPSIADAGVLVVSALRSHVRAIAGRPPREGTRAAARTSFCDATSCGDSAIPDPSRGSCAERSVPVGGLRPAVTLRRDGTIASRTTDGPRSELSLRWRRACPFPPEDRRNRGECAACQEATERARRAAGDREPGAVAGEVAAGVRGAVAERAAARAEEAVAAGWAASLRDRAATASARAAARPRATGEARPVRA